MSIASRIKKQNKSGLFGIVAGERLSGKTSIAGTLPGKTLLLQAALLETASESAEQIAKELGNHLDTVEFSSLPDLFALLKEAAKEDYDNVYVDGLSAISDIINNTREIQTFFKKDQWGAYREIGAQLTEAQLTCKQFVLDTGKNLFMTLALKPKLDAQGVLVSLDPVVKGNVAIEQMKKVCPVVLTLRVVQAENGDLIREMLTKTDGVYPGRVDSLLDQNNPGRFIASDFSNPKTAGLAGLINFIRSVT
jgi:shikimate kinase